MKTDKCAGCHQWIPAELPKSSCPVCHTGPSGGKLAELPHITLTTDKEKFPEKVVIKSLEKEFQPVDFAHSKIANKLNSISNDSTLASTFHATQGEMAICSGCHHRVKFSKNQPAKFPPCATCHSRASDPEGPGPVATSGGVPSPMHRMSRGHARETISSGMRQMPCRKKRRENRPVDTPA